MAETQKKDSEAKSSIKYTGPSVHTRILSKRDFKAADLEVDKDLVFDKSNDHTVKTEGLSQDVVDFILKQPNFKAV